MTVRNLVRLYFLSAIIAFPLISASHLLRDRPFGFAVTHAALWSAISALVFVTAHYLKARRGASCVLCVATAVDLNRTLGDPTALK